MGDSHLGQTWTKNPGKMGEDSEIGEREIGEREIETGRNKFKGSKNGEVPVYY